MSYKVAVVGATGMVGQEMLRVLEQRDFPVAELVPVASPRSAGEKTTFRGQEHTIQAISPEVFEGVELALFSAGGSASRQWCPVAAEAGALVVDNSSAFRQDPDVPLCVPEANLAAAADRPKGIIANPNCSTIQMIVALKPIHEAARLKRVVVSTYQAISGAGAQAVNAFREQAQAAAAGRHEASDTLKGQLVENLLMHWSVDADSGYQEEELKMVHETRKILGDDSIQVSPNCVRVPVITAHSEALFVETHEPINAARVRELLDGAPGIELVDDFAQGVYPKPLEAAGTDPVYVGRIRDDVGNPGGVQFWVVADNLRKGAALNAVQIAEGLLLT